MIKHPFSLLFFLVFVACCKEPIIDTNKEELHCEEVECPILDEFYGAGLLNGECWYAEKGWIDSTSRNNLTILLTKHEIDGFIDELAFLINKETNINDTIWLGWAYSNNSTPNLARVEYYYIEGHSIVGDFSFEVGSPLTYKDYLLIDYINAYTTIVEGRFQVKLPHRRVNNFVTHAPDTMNITCGSFKAKVN